MKNKIEDLRDHLFAQLERLSDSDCLLEDEIDRSKAMVDISKAIIDSARAETEFLQATGMSPSSYVAQKHRFLSVPIAIETPKNTTEEKDKK